LPGLEVIHLDLGRVSASICDKSPEQRNGFAKTRI
jgi:hypothetical protein